MDYYRKVWEELEREVNEFDHRYRVRRIHLSSKLNMFIGVEKIQKVRVLLIETPKSIIIPNEINILKGMKIEKKLIDFGKKDKNEYLVFSNVFNDTMEIYEVVIENICNGLKNLTNKVLFLKELKKILFKWQYFFDKYGDCGLSYSQQKGLYGELWTLRRLLDYEDNEKILNAWTGSIKTNHDFQFTNKALEIKTTSMKEHIKVTIASEKQLDNNGLMSLYLGVLCVNEIESGETLCDIIKVLREKFKDNFMIKEIFEEKLVYAGYLDRHSNLYNKGFVKRFYKIFRVQDGFPRLTSKDIPNGVGDIKYKIAISSCSEYEVDIIKVFSDLCNGK